MAYKSMYQVDNPYQSNDPYVQGDPYGGVKTYDAYRQLAHSYAIPQGNMAGAYHRNYLATHPAKKAELAEAGAGLGMVGGLVGGLQAKTATMALGKGLLALAGVSAGPAGLIGLAGMVGISALAGSVALKTTPILSKAASDVIVGGTELSTKMGATIGEKALLPLAKSSMQGLKKAGQYAIEKLHAKGKERYGKKAQMEQDKGMQLVSKLKDKFAQGEDIKKEINTLYKSNLGKQAQNELQILNIDNHLRNAVNNSGKISIMKVVNSLKRQAKELGWDDKRKNKEMEAFEKRLDYHKKNLTITKDNKLLTINEQASQIFLKKSEQSTINNGDNSLFQQRTEELEGKKQDSFSMKKIETGNRGFVKESIKEDVKQSFNKSQNFEDKVLTSKWRAATDFNKNIGKRDASSEFKALESSLQKEFENINSYYGASLLQAREVGEEQFDKERLKEIKNGYKNSYILANNGVDKEKLEKDGISNYVDSQTLTAHAKKLVGAGILKEKDGSFVFSDKASKELLYKNVTDSPRQLRVKNIMHQQMRQQESQQAREMPGKQHINERGR